MGEKIFWCEEIVCYGYGRNRTGDLFFVRYVLADGFIFVFYKIFWCDEVKSRKASKVISLSTLVFLRSFGVVGLVRKVHFLPNCDFGHFGF